MIATTKGEVDPLSSHTVEGHTIEGYAGDYNLAEINRRVDFEIID